MTPIEARGAITVVPPKEERVILEIQKTRLQPEGRTHGETLGKIDLKYTRRSLAETAMFRFKKNIRWQLDLDLLVVYRVNKIGLTKFLLK